MGDVFSPILDFDIKSMIKFFQVAKGQRFTTNKFLVNLFAMNSSPLVNV
ncbi:MAG: hypothetical protein ACOX7D_02650 [Alphaproteobacteria bacterium]